MNENSGNGLCQIKLFLVDGSPAGIITADVVNWTGKALSAPRSRLNALRVRIPKGLASAFLCGEALVLFVLGFGREIWHILTLESI